MIRHCTRILPRWPITATFARNLSRTRQKADCFSSPASPAATPIIELREFDVDPGHMTTYKKAAATVAPLREELAPLRSFSFPDTGGSLNVATQTYYFKYGHAERDEVRKTMQEDSEWQTYLEEQVNPGIQNVRSNVFVEAPLVANTDGVHGLEHVWAQGPAHEHNNQCILEIRRYHLKLGYDTVPKFLEYYGQGLPSKLTAPGTDPTTSLVTLLYSDVGRLNEVIEVWRHGGGTGAMEQSRIAARGATQWRTTIANIAELAITFSSTIHKPTSFSPLR